MWSAAGGSDEGGTAHCLYPNRKCHQSVVANYKYCLRHILEDKSAPYRPCSFTYPNSNKRCPLPAPKADKRDSGYCEMHLWKLLLKRQKSSAKKVAPLSTETLLSELSHYVRPVRTWNKTPSSSQDRSDPDHTPSLNPFVEVDVSKAWLRRAQVLECASESDSDGETATLDNVSRALHEESSDAESIDSQMDDPLRYSGIYTAEEAVLLARNKMMRLQMLYQKQFDKILTTLKERRRNYLTALKKEKETLCSVSVQSRHSAKDKKSYDKLKALHRYHRKSNRESIAYLSSLEKRSKQNGAVKGVASKCSYTEGGVRCCGPTLPLTKFCFKHILQDGNQCIFRACGCVKADSLCQEPVVELTGGETCLLHYKLPSLPHLPWTSTEDKSMEVESELDASATESALSTDNGVSAEESLQPEDPPVEDPPLLPGDSLHPGDSPANRSLQLDNPPADHNFQSVQLAEQCLQNNDPPTRHSLQSDPPAKHDLPIAEPSLQHDDTPAVKSLQSDDHPTMESLWPDNPPPAVENLQSDSPPTVESLRSDNPPSAESLKSDNPLSKGDLESTKNLSKQNLSSDEQLAMKCIQPDLSSELVLQPVGTLSDESLQPNESLAEPCLQPKNPTTEERTYGATETVAHGESHVQPNQPV